MSDPTNPQNVYVQYFRKTISDYFWLLVIPPIICATMALLWVLFFKTDSYTAKQSLVIRDDLIGSSYKPGRFDSLESMKSAQETILEIARKPEVIRKALTELGPPPGGLFGSSSSWPSESTIEDTQGMITISAPNGGEYGKTENILLNVRAKTRERARDFINLMLVEVDSKLIDVRDSKVKSMQSELEQSVVAAQHSFDLAAAQLQDMEQTFGADLSTLRSLNVKQPSDGTLQKSLIEIRREIREAGEEADSVWKQRELLVKSVDNPNQYLSTTSELLQLQPRLRQLVEGLSKAELELAMKVGRYEARHPEITSGKIAIRDIKAQIKREVAASIRGLADTGEMLKERHSRLLTLEHEFEKRLGGLAGKRVEYDKLEQEVQKKSDLLGKAREDLAQVQAHSTSGSVNLVTRVGVPQVSTQPDGPGKKIIVLAGLFSGLVMGLGMVMFLAPPMNPMNHTPAGSGIATQVPPNPWVPDPRNPQQQPVDGYLGGTQYHPQQPPHPAYQQPPHPGYQQPPHPAYYQPYAPGYPPSPMGYPQPHDMRQSNAPQFRENTTEIPLPPRGPAGDRRSQSTNSAQTSEPVAPAPQMDQQDAEIRQQIENQYRQAANVPHASEPVREQSSAKPVQRPQPSPASTAPMPGSGQTDATRTERNAQPPNVQAPISPTPNLDASVKPMASMPSAVPPMPSTDNIIRNSATDNVDPQVPIANRPASPVSTALPAVSVLDNEPEVVVETEIANQDGMSPEELVNEIHRSQTMVDFSLLESQLDDQLDDSSVQSQSAQEEVNDTRADRKPEVELPKPKELYPNPSNAQPITGLDFSNLADRTKNESGIENEGIENEVTPADQARRPQADNDIAQQLKDLEAAKPNVFLNPGATDIKELGDASGQPPALRPVRSSAPTIPERNAAHTIDLSDFKPPVAEQLAPPQAAPSSEVSNDDNQIPYVELPDVELPNLEAQQANPESPTPVADPNEAQTVSPADLERIVQTPLFGGEEQSQEVVVEEQPDPKDQTVEDILSQLRANRSQKVLGLGAAKNLGTHAEPPQLESSESYHSRLEKATEAARQSLESDAPVEAAQQQQTEQQQMEQQQTERQQTDSSLFPIPDQIMKLRNSISKFCDPIKKKPEDNSNDQF